MVGETGFEPATSRSQTARATKLRHSPMITETIIPQRQPRAPVNCAVSFKNEHRNVGVQKSTSAVRSGSFERKSAVYGSPTSRCGNSGSLAGYEMAATSALPSYVSTY